jgi:hypothetical protein
MAQHLDWKEMDRYRSQGIWKQFGGKAWQQRDTLTGEARDAPKIAAMSGPVPASDAPARARS